MDGQRKYQQVVVGMARSEMAADFLELMTVTDSAQNINSLADYWMEKMSKENKERFLKGELSTFDLLKMAMEKLFLAKGDDAKWMKVKKAYWKIIEDIKP